MIRPARAFIMPRSTARDSRNTDLRSVSITSSHSASFMRRRRLSRVMPALLTRMPTAPYSFSIAAMQASTAAPSLTFEQHPAAGDSRPRKILGDRVRAGFGRGGADELRACATEGEPRSPGRSRAWRRSRARPVRRALPLCPLQRRDRLFERRPIRRGPHPAAPSAMRFTKRASTLPGPHSTIWLTPCPTMARTHSTQRTG